MARNAQGYGATVFLFAQRWQKVPGAIRGLASGKPPDRAVARRRKPQGKGGAACPVGANSDATAPVGANASAARGADAAEFRHVAEILQRVGVEV
jgi:hypothetical protein